MAVSTVRRDDATAEFFDGTARGQFLLRRCAACGAVAEPYVLRCPDCESADLAAGRRLRLDFEQVPDHEVVPAFRLA